MLNLTPHSISIFDHASDKTLTICPSGTIARVTMTETEKGFQAIEGLPVPFIVRTNGAVEGLPTDGTPCLVSSMVLDAVKQNPPAGFDLSTVFAPDTGPTAIRDENGRIQAVTRLVGAV